jgi:hypothetical protein
MAIDNKLIDQLLTDYKKPGVSRSRGGRYRVYRHRRRNCPLEKRMAPEVG